MNVRKTVLRLLVGSVFALTLYVGVSFALDYSSWLEQAEYETTYQLACGVDDVPQVLAGGGNLVARTSNSLVMYHDGNLFELSPVSSQGKIKLSPDGKTLAWAETGISLDGDQFTAIVTDDFKGATNVAGYTTAIEYPDWNWQNNQDFWFKATSLEISAESGFLPLTSGANISVSFVSGGETAYLSDNWLVTAWQADGKQHLSASWQAGTQQSFPDFELEATAFSEVVGNADGTRLAVVAKSTDTPALIEVKVLLPDGMGWQTVRQTPKVQGDQVNLLGWHSQSSAVYLYTSSANDTRAYIVEARAGLPSVRLLEVKQGEGSALVDDQTVVIWQVDQKKTFRIYTYDIKTGKETLLLKNTCGG